MAWPHDAYVGQKVVCIKFGQCWCGCIPPLLILNAVYTIKSIEYCFDQVGIELIEISTPTDHAGYSAGWFRPAQEKKTDISIFTAMLTPNLEKV